jgi:dephospho-CoA kinase
MIIGITGTLGAGKGTIVDILKSMGFNHFSARDLLVEEIKKRGLNINRDSMVFIADEFRKNKSLTYIPESLYEQAINAGGNAVIESLRTPLEVEALRKKQNFILLAIDADPRVRYERIKKRGSATDMVSYEKFLEDEKREFDSKEAHRGNICGCMAMADFKLSNNGSIEDLNKEVNRIYQEILKC